MLEELRSWTREEWRLVEGLRAEALGPTPEELRERAEAESAAREAQAVLGLQLYWKGEFEMPTSIEGWQEAFKLYIFGPVGGSLEGWIGMPIDRYFEARMVEVKGAGGDCAAYRQVFVQMVLAMEA